MSNIDTSQGSAQIIKQVVQAIEEGETYTNLTPTSTTIGGIPAGSTFSNRTMQEMWNALLYPYQPPSFGTFSISGQSTAIEVGNSVPDSKTFIWTTNNSENITANSIGIYDVTGSSTIVEGEANDGSYTIANGAITKNFATNNVWQITAIPTQGSTISKNFTVNWRWRMYYGESLTSPLAESGIKGLRTSALASGFSGTFTMLAGGYKYFTWPVSFGAATRFKDASTNFDVPFENPYTVSITNSYSVTTPYYVYRSTNILGGSVSIVIS